jgi:hypothetical protein
MRSITVVLDDPFVKFLTCLIQVLKPEPVQYFFSDRSIQSFHKTILCWFACLNKKQINFIFLSPFCQRRCDKFRSIIYSQSLGLISILQYLVKDPDYPLGRYRSIRGVSLQRRASCASFRILLACHPKQPIYGNKEQVRGQ